MSYHTQPITEYTLWSTDYDTDYRVTYGRSGTGDGKAGWPRRRGRQISADVENGQRSLRLSQG